MEKETEKTLSEYFGIPITALWDMVTDKKGKFSWQRVIFYTIVGFGLILSANSDLIVSTVGNHKEAAVREKILLEAEIEKKEMLAKVLPLTIDPLNDFIQSDVIGVFTYFPDSKLTFNRLIYYTGSLPLGTKYEDFQRIMTEKTHTAVQNHSKGLPDYAETKGDKVLLNMARPFNMYVYSCPIYNAKAEYDGAIAFYWHELPDSDTWNTEEIYVSCNSAAREIGMYL